MKRRVLVFGEDYNDAAAVAELVRGLRPDFTGVKARREPAVLVKGLDEARARKKLAKISEVLRHERALDGLQGVVIHEDADAVEPAHEGLAESIEAAFGRDRFWCVAAVPAWEIEAWWLLWPDLVASIHHAWQVPRPNHQVGKIRDPKGFLRRSLVVGVAKRGRARVHTYEESDSLKIARLVVEQKMLGETTGESLSWERFIHALGAVEA